MTTEARKQLVKLCEMAEIIQAGINPDNHVPPDKATAAASLLSLGFLAIIANHLIAIRELLEEKG